MDGKACLYTLEIIVKSPVILARNFFYSKSEWFREYYDRTHKYGYIQTDNMYFKELVKRYGYFKFFVGDREKIKNKTILEIGPGSNLVIPLLAIKDGAKKYYAIDSKNNLCNEKEFLDLYREIDNGKIHEDMLKLLKNVEVKSFEGKELAYFVVRDGNKFPIEDSSVDIIYSNGVLSQVGDLENMFREMKRVLKKGGLMNHNITIRDHRWNKDSLSFLKVNKKLYDFLLKNALGYSNRKRYKDYLKLFKKYNLKMEMVNVDTRYSEKEVRRFYGKTDDFLSVATFSVILKKI